MSEKEIHPSNWKFRLWYWAIMLVLFFPFGAMGPLGWILWAVLLSLTDPIVRGLLRLIGKSQGYRVNFDGPSEERTTEAAAEVAAKSRDEINTAIASVSNWAETQARQLKEKHLPADKDELQVAGAKQQRNSRSEHYRPLLGASRGSTRLRKSGKSFDLNKRATSNKVSHCDLRDKSKRHGKVGVRQCFDDLNAIDKTLQGMS